MTNTLKTFFALVCISTLGMVSALAVAQVGQPAPSFTLKDTSGKSESLADFKGKYVVLEWLNHGCPFVVGQYKPGLMQATQTKATGMGAVWLSVNSTNPGHQDFNTPEKESVKAKETGSKATAILLDPDGKVGKEYGAKTTPHVFVVNPEGVIIYAGAIDNRQEGDKIINYVIQALTEAQSGKPVSTPETKPYGCGVKYQN